MQSSGVSKKMSPASAAGDREDMLTLEESGNRRNSGSLKKTCPASMSGKSVSVSFHDEAANQRTSGDSKYDSPASMVGKHEQRDHTLPAQPGSLGGSNSLERASKGSATLTNKQDSDGRRQSMSAASKTACDVAASPDSSFIDSHRNRMASDQQSLKSAAPQQEHSTPGSSSFDSQCNRSPTEQRGHNSIELFPPVSLRNRKFSNTGARNLVSSDAGLGEANFSSSAGGSSAKEQELEILKGHLSQVFDDVVEAFVYMDRLGSHDTLRAFDLRRGLKELR